MQALKQRKCRHEYENPACAYTSSTVHPALCEQLDSISSARYVNEQLDVTQFVPQLTCHLIDATRDFLNRNGIRLVAGSFAACRKDLDTSFRLALELKAQSQLNGTV